MLSGFFQNLKKKADLNEFSDSSLSLMIELKSSASDHDGHPNALEYVKNYAGDENTQGVLAYYDLERSLDNPRADGAQTVHSSFLDVVKTAAENMPAKDVLDYTAFLVSYPKSRDALERYPDQAIGIFTALIANQNLGNDKFGVLSQLDTCGILPMTLSVAPSADVIEFFESLIDDVKESIAVQVLPFSPSFVQALSNEEFVDFFITKDNGINEAVSKAAIAYEDRVRTTVDAPELNA